MKRKHIITLLALMTLLIMSCGNKNEKQMSNNTSSQTKTLVAYFSATGTTKKVAEEIAKITHADIHEIVPAQPYTEADLDWNDSTSRSSVEMRDKNSRPEIKASDLNIAKYDTVYLGYPIWWYVAPTIINTFIEQNNLEGKIVRCFATSGGSPIQPCVDSLKVQYPTVQWAPGRLLNNSTTEEIKQWINS